MPNGCRVCLPSLAVSEMHTKAGLANRPGIQSAIPLGWHVLETNGQLCGFVGVCLPDVSDSRILVVEL